MGFSQLCFCSHYELRHWFPERENNFLEFCVSHSALRIYFLSVFLSLCTYTNFNFDCNLDSANYYYHGILHKSFMLYKHIYTYIEPILKQVT